MSALELLQAEIQIVCRDAETLPWSLDPELWSREPPGNVMTPQRMRAQLRHLVDSYEHDGSLSAQELDFVRGVIDKAIASVTGELALRMGVRP